jgi:hypothetical protein
VLATTAFNTGDRQFHAGLFPPMIPTDECSDTADPDYEDDCKSSTVFKPRGVHKAFVSRRHADEWLPSAFGFLERYGVKP